MSIVRCVIFSLGEMQNCVCKPGFIHFLKSKVLFLLIMEEEYCVLWIVQDLNWPGFITIMNRFHTATHQHAKQSALRCVILRLANLYRAVYLPSFYSCSQV
jgi:hypothetical protein